MNQNNKQSGFLMLEVCLSLALFIIVILTMYNSKIATNIRISNSRDNILSILQKARTYALSKQQKVLICTIDKNKKCSKNWNNGNIATIVNNKIINSIQLQQDIIKWKSSLNNSQQIEFNKHGATQGEQGTMFIGCKDKLPCYKIVINFAGNISI